MGEKKNQDIYAVILENFIYFFGEIYLGFPLFFLIFGEVVKVVSPRTIWNLAKVKDVYLFDEKIKNGENMKHVII